MMTLIRTSNRTEKPRFFGRRRRLGLLGNGLLKQGLHQKEILTQPNSHRPDRGEGLRQSLGVIVLGTSIGQEKPSRNLLITRNLFHLEHTLTSFLWCWGVSKPEHVYELFFYRLPFVSLHGSVPLSRKAEQEGKSM